MKKKRILKEKILRIKNSVEKVVGFLVMIN